MLKRTPLYEWHRQLGGKLIEFGGWEMPVQYTSIMDEHLAVRSAAGIFDISHMGEFLIEGPGALAFLNMMLTNNASILKPGQAQYSLMCNEKGGVVDDLYVYCLAEQKYLLIVNASRIEADFNWLLRWFKKMGLKGTHLVDISDKMGAVAVQGPKVTAFIDDCFPGKPLSGMLVESLTELRKNQVCEKEFHGHSLFIARTGYTGEDGFEIVAPAEVMGQVWETILKVGGPFGIKPAGLGARDTLRTEVCYPLYGHELGEQITPIEAGLGFFVALDKPDFVGRSVLAEQKTKGVTRKCVAFKMVDKSAPPRPGYPIWSKGISTGQIGEVVSGTQSPSLGCGIGLGFVPSEFSKPGTPLEIEIRNKKSLAQVVAKPIYCKEQK